MIRRKIIRKGIAVSLAFLLGVTSVNGNGLAWNVPIYAAVQNAGDTTLFSADFNQGVDGWSYGTGWEYNYSAKDSSIESDNSMLKMNVDFSKDSDQSWSQVAASYWNNDGITFSRANKVTLDFLYDSSKMTTGSFSIKAYSNAGIDAYTALDLSTAETVTGSIKQLSVTIEFSQLSASAKDQGFALCLIGNNTDYKGAVWFDNVIVTGAPEPDTSIDSTISVKSADEEQVSVSDGNLVTQKEDGSTEETKLSKTVTLVDKNATESTKQIYSYLKAVGESESVIYGHQDDTFQKAGSSDLTSSDTSDVTGSIAGVFGIDGLSLVGNEYSAKAYNESHKTYLPETAEGNILAAAKLTNEAIEQGAIVTLSAHMPDFGTVEKNSSYNRQTDPDFAKYDFTPITYNDATNDPVNNILPGGKYNKIYRAYLDMIADYASRVDGTILFRPFHENTGSWFWWGAAYCDAETFKNIYRYTVEYLRDTKNIHNILYEYGPSNTGSSTVAEYEVRYPGDNYVDIVGVDMYDSSPSSNGVWMEQFKEQLDVVNQFAKNHGKLFTVTETGAANDTAEGDNQTALLKTGNGDKDWYNEVLSAVSETDASYFLLWANFSKTNGFYTPYVDSVNADGSLHGHEMLDNFISFYNDGRSIFAANQKELLTGSSTSTIKAKAVSSKATGYIISPLAGNRIVSATTATAKVTNVTAGTAVKFVFETSTNTVTIKPYRTSNGYYKVALTAKQLKTLGKKVGTLSLYINGKSVQSISETYNIPKPVDDATLADGFENYSGVDSQLTKAWTINKDNNCSVSLTLDKTNKLSGTYGLKFTYDETSTGWGGATISKTADWSNCNALQFYVVPDGNNQKTVIQITANGTVYEAYLNTYSAYAKAGKTPMLVTIPFADFCQRDTTGNPKGGLVKDCKAITSLGLWVNAIQDSSAISNDRVTGNLYYDAITAVKVKSTAFSAIKISSTTCKNLMNQTVKLNTSNATLTKGNTKQLKATVTGSGDTSVTWYSTNTVIASVTSSGKVTANRTGTAAIVAKTRGGKQASCTIKVTTASGSDKDIVEAPSNYVNSKELDLAEDFQDVDNSALAAVMKKAAEGKDVTIAVIGGSITQGTVSSGSSDSEVENKSAYANIFFNWWKETFPNTEFNFVNAGIGATDSYLGVHRVQTDVLSKDPDLVLVEYAVNDSSTDFYKKTYDNLVRRILKSDSSPAVLLLFMSQINGDSAQDIESEIGLQYQLPMLSYKNVMNYMLDNNIYTEGQLSGDTVHPSALGHTITGEIIWKYLNSIYEKSDSYNAPTAFDKDAVTDECYMDAQILDSSNTTPDSMGTFAKSNVFSTYPNDWTCSDGTGEITFQVSCKNVGIMYYCQIDGKGGQFDVYVDGEKVNTLDADFTGGWGNYARTTECYTSDEAATHTVTIKKADNSTGDEFTVLGLLISK